MTAFKRRRPEPETAAPEPAVAVEAPVVEMPAEIELPAHVERSLIMLTTKLQTCIERLESLEERMDEMTEHAMNAPSHSDVLEVRMHSAKLAAELARATVELRGEIGMASDEARRAARAARAQQLEAEVVVAPNTLDLVSEEEHTGSQKPHPFSATA